MQFDAAPPVDAAVQRALLAALEHAGALAQGPSRYDRAWRRAALREGVDDEDSPAGYAFSPRSTRGATRA